MCKLTPGRIYQGDCLELFERIDDASIDLAFADPPFNIGYDYDQYDDRQEDSKYLDWCRKWIREIHRSLKNNGTFWLAIGDEYAAELKMIAQREVGFHCRSWVIWYYTFGVNCVRAFTRSHAHLLHFVKDREAYTFNAENPKVRVKSARQLVYGDGRSNPKGRLPDDTWFLRPQDMPSNFLLPNHDTWYFSRVAGTFKEREGFHGCQMPEQLLGRIIRLSSNPGEVVLDPFAGSGTTAVVSKKLGRRWLGLELSGEYVRHIDKRLNDAVVGGPLDGPANPRDSSPTTSRGRLHGRQRNGRILPPADEEDMRGVISAFQETCQGRSADFMLCDAELNRSYTKACKRNGIKGNAYLWNVLMLRARKMGKLPKATQRGPLVTFEQMDAYSFASEIAMRMMEIEFGRTLDDVLCWPELAQEFDRFAKLYAPDRTEFELRWAALAIRKRASKSRSLAEKNLRKWRQKRLPKSIAFSSPIGTKYDQAGVYVVEGDQQRLYVGETSNLRRRLQGLQESQAWRDLDPTSLRILRWDSDTHAFQSLLVNRHAPLLNTQLLVNSTLQRQLLQKQ